MWAEFVSNHQHIKNVLSVFAGITSKYLLMERHYYGIKWYKQICIISKQIESRLSELLWLHAVLLIFARKTFRLKFTRFYPKTQGKYTGTKFLYRIAKNLISDK